MEAAVWRSNTTFISFYLRDLSHQFLDVSSLGTYCGGAVGLLVFYLPCIALGCQTLYITDEKRRTHLELLALLSCRLIAMQVSLLSKATP